MTEEDFRARLKLHGYQKADIEELVGIATEKATENIFSASWYFQDIFDMIRSQGMDKTLKFLRGK